MTSPNSSTNSKRNDAGIGVPEALIVAAGVFGLTVWFKVLTTDAINLSSLWLANGFFLGMLLTSPRHKWPLQIAAFLITAVGAAFYLGAPTAVIPWFGVFNLAEIMVAALLLPPGLKAADDLTVRRNFLSFLGVAVVLAPSFLVVLLGIFSLAISAPLNADFLLRVLVGHALGFAVMTPVMLALRSGEAKRFLKPNALLEAMLTILTVASVAAVVFFQTSLPILFLVYPPMILVAYRGGFVGTALAILVVVVIGAIATAANHGPIAMARANLPELRAHPFFDNGFVLLQIFIASLLFSLFPMIVSLAEGRRAHREAEELENRLRLLMEHTSNVILLTDLDGRRLYVSPVVRDLLGIEPAEFIKLGWQDYVHPADFQEVTSQIETALREKLSRTMAFRIRHHNGSELWIEASMKYFRDRAFDLTQTEKDHGMVRNCGPDGDEGFVVTLHDATQRRQMEIAMKSTNAELSSLVWKDSLTKLANRRRFDEALQEAWQSSLDSGRPLAVLLIDVDHFKQFNDYYGHQHGDLCLIGVADSIAGCLFHPDDLAARYGGEEFAVILRQTNIDDAARVAERIRTTVHRMARPHAGSKLGALTVSVGVAAALPCTHGDPIAIVAAADEALYISKREGRNRTTVLDVNWPLQSAAAG